MTSSKDLIQKFRELPSAETLQTENLKLKEEIKALNTTVSKLCKEIERLGKVDTNVTKIYLSPEEEICALQIASLQAASRQRKLSLEEIKTLDLLIKNKRLMEDKSTSNAEITLPDDNISEDELMRIAESVEEKKGDES